MSLTTTEFGNALAALTADLIAGTITQAEYADGAADLFLELIGMETSNPGLALRMGLLVSQWQEAAGLLFNGTLADESELPTSGNRLGDLWLIDGDMWLWTFDPEEGPTDTPTLIWVNVGRLQGEIGPAGEITDITVEAGEPGTGASVVVGGTPSARTIALTIPRGDTGDTGPTPNLTIGSVLTGAPGSPAEADLTGTADDPVLNLTIPEGDPGTDGTDGDDGSDGNDAWSPVLAVVADGERRVHQVVDWIGGEGAKPATGQFIGPAGFVATAAEAANVRGAQGTSGAGTGDMLSANNLSDVADDAAARSNLDVWSKSEADGRYRAAGAIAQADVTGLIDDLNDKADLTVTAALDTRIDALEGAPAPTKATVGLGDVDNTSDADKPVSTAQQAALDLKLNASAKASTAEVREGSKSTKFITPQALTASDAWVAADATGTVTLDLSTGRNRQLNLTGNVTLAVPTNMADGQSGTIVFVQPASGGPRTLALNAAIKKFGTFTLSTAANAVDRCGYIVRGGVLELTALEKGLA